VDVQPTGDGGQVVNPKTGEVNAKATPEAVKDLDELMFAVKVSADDLLKRYPGAKELTELTAAQATDALEWLHELDEKGASADPKTDTKPTEPTAGEQPRFRGGK